MRAMILAAGRGERMRPLTDHMPKPLIPVAGKPLIQWHLEKLARAGIAEVVINHAWLGSMLEQTLGSGQQFGLNIRYSPEPHALETAGGIATALPLLMVPNPVQHPAGDFLLESNGLLHDEVALAANAVRHTFAGIGVYQPELFEHTPAHRPAKLAPLLRQAMKNNQVCGTLHQSEWIDVGTPDRLAALEVKIASIHYEN